MELPIDSNEIIEMKKNLEKFDKAYLVTLCDFIINQYILKEGAGYSEELDEVYNENKPSSEGAHTFPEFIKDLQRRFNYPELQRFSVEAEKVFLSINNQKIQINGNRVQNVTPAPPRANNEDRDFFSRHATGTDETAPSGSNDAGSTGSGDSGASTNGGNTNRFGSLEFDE